jgi:predicted DNA-binding transcriptional regulator AlpA
MPTTAKDRFLSFREVSELIGLKVGTIRNGGAGTDEITRLKIGGRVFFSQRAVEAWMSRRIREAEDKKALQRNAAAELLADKRRRQAAVKRALLTIVTKGGRRK